MRGREGEEEGEEEEETDGWRWPSWRDLHE